MRIGEKVGVRIGLLALSHLSFNIHIPPTIYRTIIFCRLLNLQGKRPLHALPNNVSNHY